MRDDIIKAEKALRTGQPRLARLYMKGALEETPGGRSWLAWRELVQTARSVYDVATGFVESLGAAARERENYERGNYALAGPAKGGAA